MAEEIIKPGEEQNKDTVPKADFDKLNTDHDKAKQDLEDIRMEVLTPDYLEYLNNKEKPAEKPDEKPKLEDDAIEKLSKKDLLALAKKEAKAEMQLDLDGINKGRKADKDARVEKEISEFAETHEDFKTYRPIMYGLSLDPKFKNASLSKLYAEAKDHVKGIHAETPESEKNRQRKQKGMKPGGDNESYDALRKLSTAEATAQAAEEVEAQLGPMPQS